METSIRVPAAFVVVVTCCRDCPLVEVVRLLQDDASQTCILGSCTFAFLQFGTNERSLHLYPAFAPDWTRWSRTEPDFAGFLSSGRRSIQAVRARISLVCECAHHRLPGKRKD